MSLSVWAQTPNDLPAIETLTQVKEGFYKDSDGENFYVYDAAGLSAWHDYLAQTNTGGTQKRTFHIANDIDANGYVWTPVDAHQDRGQRFGAINGHNNTISNMTINGPAMFERFATGCEITIKDLAFDHVDVVSTEDINSSILVVQTYDNLTLDNVDAKNCNITARYKVAVLVGTVYDESLTSSKQLTLKDCNVSNCTVTSTSFDYMTCGLVSFVNAGDGETISFDNCTITDTDLYSRNPNGYTVHAFVYAEDDAIGKYYDSADGVTVTNCYYEPYNIVYDLDGGVNAESNPAKYSSDGRQNITLADATKANYAFAGWQDEYSEVPTKGVSIKDNPGYGVENLLYKAIWIDPVAQIGTTGYATLAEAIAAANGDTVKLLADVDEAVTISGKTLTLDLNGFNMKTNGRPVTVKDGAKLTIMSSNAETQDADHNAVVDARTNGVGSVAAIGENAVVTVDAGYYYAFNGNKAGMHAYNGGTIIFNGGVVSGADHKNGAPAPTDKEGKVFYAGANNQWYDGTTPGTIIVTGGSFSGRISDSNGGHYLISGGTFDRNILAHYEDTNCTVGHTGYNADRCTVDQKESINTGRTITMAEAGWLAEGYEAKDNNNGTWTVAPKPFYEDTKGIYHITSLAGLEEFRNSVNGTGGVDANNYSGKTVKLEADIDLKNIANWEPIGKGYYHSSKYATGTDKGTDGYKNGSTPFTGTFDGGNHTISNLNVATADADELDGGWAAGLFGIVKNGTVKNLTINNANVSSTTRFAGAVAGGVTGGTIENCTVQGAVDISSRHFVGGIAGMSYGTITGCSVTATGTISANDTRELADEKDRDGDDVGGIVGYINSTASVTNSTVDSSDLTVQGIRQVGAVVGMIDKGSVDTGSTSNAKIVRIINSKAQLEAFRNEVNAGNTFEGVTVKLTADILDLGEWTPIGTGAHDDQGAITGGTGAPNGTGWTLFKGTFDGDGHTISGMSIANGTGGSGLFGAISNATIENLTIAAPSINANDFAGAVAGYAYASKIQNVDVTGALNVSASHYVGGAVGYAADTDFTDVDVIGSSGNITATDDGTGEYGDDAGGLVGYAVNTTEIKDGCDVSGIKVSAARQGGGLVGLIQKSSVADATVKNVVVEAATTDKVFAEKGATKVVFGGIAGGLLHDSASIKDSKIENVSLIVASGVSESVKGKLRMGYISGGTYKNATFEAATGNTGSGNTVTGSSKMSGTLTYGGSENVVDGDATDVAQIGSVKYSSLAGAAAAVKNGEMITMLADATISGYVEVAPEGKNVTLDLNDKTISGGALDVYGTLTITGEGTVSGIRHGIWVNEGGVLNVQSGTITTTGVGYPIIANPGTVTISGGTITNANGAGAVYVNNGSLTISGGTIESTKDNTDAICISGNTVAAISGGTVTGHDWGVTAFDTASLTVSGTAVINTADNEGYAISTNGNAGQNATIIINGGTITGKELGIYQPSGKLTVSDGIITGATGIYFKSNSLNISGGTITGNGTAADYDYNGNGANPTGDALVIDSCGYPNGINDVAVTGGNFNSVNAKAVACYTHLQNTPVENFITGGKYSSEPDSSYVASGYKAASINESPYLYQVGIAVIKTSNADINTTANSVSYTVDTVVKENESANAAEIETKNNLAVEVKGQTGETESKAPVYLSDNVKSDALKEIVSSAIETAGTKTTNATKTDIEIAVVKSAPTQVMSSTDASMVAKVTYEVHPEATITVTTNEGSEEVGTVALSNSQIKGSFTFKLDAVGVAEAGDKVKVTHIHEDGTSDETVCTVDSDGYVTVTVTSFSQFELEEITVSEPLADYGQTISLEDSIDIFFNLKNLKQTPSSYTVQWRKQGTDEWTIGETPTSPTLNQYKVASCAAKEMGDLYEVQVLYDGALIKTATLSIKGYCEAVINGNFGTKITDLCKATLDYGRYAQETFNYETGNLVNGGKDYFLNSNITVPPYSVEKSKDGAKVTGVSFALVTTSETQFIVNFTVSGPNAITTVKVDGVDAIWTANNGKVQVVIEGIVAKDLAKDHTIIVTDNSGSYTFTASPVDYMGLAVAYNSQVAVNRAFYNYYLKAAAYFAN